VPVASLFVGFASGVTEDTVAGAVMTVPAAVPAGTFSTTEKVALPPTASPAIVHVIVPVPPVGGKGLQFQPAGGTREAKVVFAGIFSTKLVEPAAAGPWLKTDPTMVTVVPAVTVGAEATLLRMRSAEVATLTVVMAVAELFARFGSEVPETILATSTICVPLGVVAPTVTATVKVPFVPAAKTGFVQLMFPVAPTAGVVQVQPAAATMELKVVFAGIVSLKTAFTASNAPPFVTGCV